VSAIIMFTLKKVRQTSVQFRPMTLPRLLVPKRHFDERGWFAETYHESRLRGLGIDCRFVQENQSYSKRTGTLRGMHFQKPPADQAKLISVLRGRIFDVAVDVRRNSPTFGNHVSAELSAESALQLYIPAGFAHGFLTLENDVIVNYKVSKSYAPAHEGGIRWDDPDIGVVWPIEPSNVSKKDRLLPFLKDFDSPFAYEGPPLRALSPPEGF
jgi:dTDP-4-dehydrorhamnose 3,5-epimerase